MGHLYENFSVNDRKVFHSGMTQGATAIKAAWKTIQNVKRDPNQTNVHYRNWFGAATKERVKLVYEAISTMNYAVSASSIKFRRTPGNRARAAASPPEEGWENKSVRQIIDSGRFVINFYDPYFQATSEDRGGEYGPAKTFVHELSHVVAETNEPIGTWPEVYGKIRCRELADNNPDHAIRNADSYGYFCVAHLQFILAKQALERKGLTFA